MAGALQRNDGSNTQPVVGIVPDVVHHTDVLPGNDTINGDDGRDFIVADNANAYSPLITGFAGIDSVRDSGNVAEQTHLALARAMHSLGLLSVDYLRTTGPAEGVTHEVVVASDTVDGGTGEDHIVGDDGMIVADFVLGIPTTGSLEDAALELQQYVADVQRLANDFEFVTFEAHYQTLQSLLNGGATTTSDDPDFHDLVIGKDSIVGGANNDVITGDHVAILTDIADGQQISTVGTQIDPELRISTEAALASLAETQNSDLAAHLIAHHNTANRTFTPQQLASLPIDFDFDQSIGNDNIQANDGDDLVIGDFGAYAFPVLETTPTTFTDEQTAGRDIDKLTSGMARWLEQQHHERTYETRITVGYDHPLYEVRGGNATQWQIRAGNDTIDAGEGNDFVLGDSFSISTNMVADDLVARFSEEASQFKVGFLDRRNFELTEHFARFGGTSLFGNDTVHGGDGQDILFGQTQSNTLFGEAGDDQLFGGAGPNNVADGGSGGGIARAGSSINPTGVWLRLLEDYQFDAMPPLATDLGIDVLATHDLATSDYGFEELVGNFRPR